MSKLTYGIQVWGFAPKYLITKLQVLQNKAARVVLGHKSLKYSNIKIMKEMNWLPVDKLITLQIAKLCHTIIHQKTPRYLYERIVSQSNIQTRMNIGHKLGAKPRNIGSTSITKDTFVSRIFSLYNGLPSILTSITCKTTFSKYPQHYIFDPMDLPSYNDPKFTIFGLLPGLN